MLLAAAMAAAAFSASLAARAGPAAFQPPPDDAIPKGAMGDAVRLGRAIFHDPRRNAGAFVGNDLACTNCHLQDGRLAGSSPLWAAWVSYPAFRAKTGQVDSFEERLRGCFRYSMNGREPPPGDPVLVALQAYAFFLARGLPTGEAAPGRGYPEVPKPALAPDYARGQAAFAEKCASCHGADGAGQMAESKAADGAGRMAGGMSAGAAGQVVDGRRVPPLWGARSFNWGAGMAVTRNAAGFIRANMPYGQGGTLSAQQAWDLATYVDSQMRPQDPRFTGDVAATRAAFHDTPFSMYGLMVQGRLLGDPATTPPFDTAPAR